MGKNKKSNRPYGNLPVKNGHRHCHFKGIDKVTTVRVLMRLTAVSPFVYMALTGAMRCDRFEPFMRFSFSRSFANLPGCIPEDLSSPNSLIKSTPSNFAGVFDATTETTKSKP